MAWIESHTTMDRHPKLLLFKNRMRWSKNEAVGFLHRFWWTVMEYAPSGALRPQPGSVADAVIPSLPLEVMSETLDMEPDLFTQAVNAMVEVGLLERRGDILVVHDWLDYAGKYLAESRFKRNPAMMKRIEDFHASDTPPARPMPVPGLSEDSQRTVSGKSAVPYQTIPDQTKPPLSPPQAEADPPESQPPRRTKATANVPIPEILDTPEFRLAWGQWEQHRREARKPLTPTAVKQQVAKLAEWGVERAIAAINHSIRNGYQGIFEDKDHANHRNNRPRSADAGLEIPELPVLAGGGDDARLVG